VVAVFPDEVFKERQQLSERIAAAPGDYLQDNGAALLRIVWELQASLALELQVIQGIKRLDVTDARAVAVYVDRFSDYVERRDFNLERTSCGRIARIYWQQIRVLEGGPGGGQRVTDLDRLLQGFADADRQFTEEIEPFMKRALATLTGIRDATAAGRIEEATVRQAQFAEEYRAEVERLKSTITGMSRVGESLLAGL
jgi:hypothetical protein